MGCIWAAIWSGIPATIVGLASYLIYAGFRVVGQIGWWRVTLGSLLLLSIVGWVFVLAGGPGYSVMYAAFVYLPTTAVGLVAGALMLWKLRGRRKLAAAGVALLFPLAQFAASWVSAERYHEAQTRCQMEVAAQALERYHINRGRFPQELVTRYEPFAESRQSQSGRLTDAYLRNTPGWDDCRWPVLGPAFYYTSTPDHYTLGQQVPNATLLAPRVCLYSSDAPTIQCRFNYWGPFTPRP